MRFVAGITEAASHATPLIADTLRRFSSAAMPHADIPARLSKDKGPIGIGHPTFAGVSKMVSKAENAGRRFYGPS
jgi:hypothetical protein